jgi:aminopeptidase
MDDVSLARLAELAVDFGANVQPGQIVSLSGSPGKEYLVRAIAEQAYRKGAKFVDVSWFDPWVKRARIEYAPDDSLEFVPPWYGERLLALGRERSAAITLSGPVAPALLDDLDPVRAGRDRLPAVRESGEVVSRRELNWTILPCPTSAWAKLVHPDLDDDEALAKLEQQLLHVLRLDEEDPVAVWKQRADTLIGVAERLTSRAFDALHYEGPGTDLTVGLLPSSKWLSAGDFTTIDGIVHMPNLPSEEVFTCPDPTRTDGVVRSTKPLVVSGSIIRGLEVEFREGRAVRIDAEEGAEVLRGYAARDEGASRLGEVALVDKDGRIGPLDTVFFDTLLDENAASHIAIGQAYAFTAGEEDRERINTSAIHIDFMIGGAGVDTFAIDRDGNETPLLVGGAWQV